MKSSRPNAEERTVDEYPNLVEVEGARDAVDERDAVEEQGAGEESEEDVLGTGLSTLRALLVEGHECRHGHGGEFETDEEHEEVSAGNHEVHAQQGEEHELVELALLDEVLLAAEPLVGHEEGDEGAEVEHGLHHGHHGRVLIHAAKSLSRRSTAAGQEVERGVHSQQDGREGRVENATPALLVRAHEEVGQEQHYNDC